MPSFYVYILSSKKDNKLYIGQTGCLEKRLRAHHDGRVRSTKNRRPLELVFKEEFKSRAQAIFKEREIKSMSGKVFKDTLRRLPGRSSLG